MTRLARFRERLDAALPKASMSVATLALVVASAGGVGAYAAAKIGTADLKNNAVTSAKIKNGNVGPADLSAKARTHSWVWQPGPVLETTWPASGERTLATKKIKVAAPGVLEIDTLAAPVGPGSSPDVFVALVDYKGSVAPILGGGGGSPAEVARFYDSLAVLTSNFGGQTLSIPQRVSAGKHTIRWVALNSSVSGGEDLQLALRKLTIQYQPGVTGKETRWSIPAPREVARQLAH